MTNHRDQPLWVQAALAYFPNRTTAVVSMALAFVLTSMGALGAAFGAKELLLLTLFFGLGAWHMFAIQWMDRQKAWEPVRIRR